MPDGTVIQLKDGQKLHALSRISCFLDTDQQKRIMKAFILSQFNYYPLVWMFCDRTLNNKVDRIHEWALRITYKDMTSDFDTMLVRDNAIPIHIRNLQLLLLQVLFFFLVISLKCANFHEIDTRNA